MYTPGKMCEFFIAVRVSVNYRRTKTNVSLPPPKLGSGGIFRIPTCICTFRAMVLSRLDYCNGLLGGGAPKSLLCQLSGVMRAAARLILVLPRQSHVTSEIRARLHWLDMPSRVQFKLCCLAFRCLHGFAPPYLASYFIPVGSIEGRSQLRSAAAGLLLVPTHLDGDNRPPGIRCFLSCHLEQSPGRSSWSRHQSS